MKVILCLITVVALIGSQQSLATSEDAKIDPSSSEMKKYFPSSASTTSCLRRLRKGLKKYPESPMLFAARATVYEQAGNLEAALKDIDFAANKEPNKYSLRRAELNLKANKNSAQVLEDCRLAAKASSVQDAAYAYLLSARAYHQLGQDSMARTEAENAWYSIVSSGYEDAHQHLLPEIRALTNVDKPPAPRKSDVNLVCQSIKQLSNLAGTASLNDINKFVGTESSSKNGFPLWREIKSEVTPGKNEVTSLFLRVNTVRCCITEEDLKQCFGNTALINCAGGPEQVFQYSTKHCTVTFSMWPSGYKPLIVVKLEWKSEGQPLPTAPRPATDS
jgi:hypothetical protein